MIIIIKRVSAKGRDYFQGFFSSIGTMVKGLSKFQISIIWASAEDRECIEHL